jgi:phage-related protein
MVDEIGDAFARLKANMVDPAEEATEQTTEKFEEMADNSISALSRLASFAKGIGGIVGGVAKGIGSAIVGSSGVLSGAADAWKTSQTDPETGEKKATIDLAGGITGVLTSLITSSSQFGELMEAINPILQKVADFFGRLLTPLIPIVTLIADALMPLLNLLEPFLLQITWLLEKVVTPIISFLSNLIITIYNTIAGVFNWVLGIIDSLPFVSVKYRLPTAETVNPATATAEESTASGGGTQVSEITGATRDLLTSLLSPLSSLDSLTGIGNRIYDLLEDRLVGGVTIGTINVTPANGESVSEATAREIEEAISERLAFMGAV